MPSEVASHAATQRVPLPESSASLPSALNSRKKNSPLGLRSRNSIPSAPILVLRLHNFRARVACWRLATSSSRIRKSFPHACALTKGIITASFFLTIAKHYNLVCPIALTQSLKHLLVALAVRRDKEAYSLEPSYVVFLLYAQSYSHPVQHAENGDIHPPCIISADLVQHRVML